MTSDLKVGVRRQIDQLRKELAAAAGRVSALQDEIKKHELIYGMLDRRNTSRRSRRRSTVGAKRGPTGTMIDWNAVIATLPDQFTLDVMSAHETTREKPRSYLRQVVARWSKEGRIKRIGRGIYQKSGALPRVVTPEEKEAKPNGSGKNGKATDKGPQGMSTTEPPKEERTGKRRGIQPLEGTDYGDGIVLGKADGYKQVKESRSASGLFEGNSKKDDMRKFFVNLEKAGEITVATLKKLLSKHGGENQGLIQRRLNWFSLGRYNKHNWHVTVKQVGSKATGSDKVLFHQIEKRDQKKES